MIVKKLRTWLFILIKIFIYILPIYPFFIAVDGHINKATLSELVYHWSGFMMMLIIAVTLYLIPKLVEIDKAFLKSSIGKIHD